MQTAHTLRGEGFDASKDGTGRGTPLVPVHREIAPTLTGNYGKQPDSSDTSMGPMLVPVAFPANLSGTQHASTENLAPAMGAKNPTAVAFGVGESPDLGHCLRSGASKADKHESTTYALHAMQVRRLTPVECERLQGFSDNYTLIPWRKKPADECPDGPRYKALGNSWAVPNVRWLGRRIDAALKRSAA